MTRAGMRRSRGPREKAKGMPNLEEGSREGGREMHNRGPAMEKRKEKKGKTTRAA